MIRADGLLPTFDELPELPGLQLRHAWEVYGPGDTLGSINLVTPEKVTRAAGAGRLVAGCRRGKMVVRDSMPHYPLEWAHL